MSAGKITVEERSTAEGWEFHVLIQDPDGSRSKHVVTLRQADYQRLRGGEGKGKLKVSPAKLVEESFKFLLEREPKESILSRFELPVIGRYFPEYERELARRLGRTGLG